MGLMVTYWSEQYGMRNGVTVSLCFRGPALQNTSYCCPFHTLSLSSPPCQNHSCRPSPPHPSPYPCVLLPFHPLSCPLLLHSSRSSTPLTHNPLHPFTTTDFSVPLTSRTVDAAASSTGGTNKGAASVRRMQQGQQGSRQRARQRSPGGLG